MTNKSITIKGDAVKYAFIIKDINVDEISLEKWSVICRPKIDDAWSDKEDKLIEVVLEEKLPTIRMLARAKVIEIAAHNSGKIIKNFKTDRKKGARKTYIGKLIFFEEPGGEETSSVPIEDNDIEV